MAGLVIETASGDTHGERVQAAHAALQARIQKLETLRPHVRRVVAAIRALTLRQCVDEAFIENEFLPFVGLNDEMASYYPRHLAPWLGKGLHVWQNPNQLAPCLAWLTRNVRDVTTYAEIGPRWGGMTILLCEWLRKTNPALRTAIAIDPLGATPLLNEYFAFVAQEGEQRLTPIMLAALSTAPEVAACLETHRPDFVFIDGDHSCRGAMSDHMLVRGFARHILYHDVHSQLCETTLVWRWLKVLETPTFDSVEFTAQYKSVAATVMGLGVLTRRKSDALFDPTGA